MTAYMRSESNYVNTVEVFRNVTPCSVVASQWDVTPHSVVTSQ